MGTSTVKATTPETSPIVAAFKAKKPYIGAVDKALKTLKVAFLMVDLARVGFRGSDVMLKVLWGARGVTNLGLLIADSGKLKTVTDTEKKEQSGMETTQDNYSITYRIVTLLRDTFKFTSLFSDNQVLGDAADWAEGLATGLATLRAVMTWIAYSKKAKDERTAEDKIDLVESVADLTSDFTDMSFLPTGQILGWISLTTAGSAGMLAFAANIMAIRRQSQAAKEEAAKKLAAPTG